jgi:hypothetical protein
MDAAVGGTRFSARESMTGPSEHSPPGRAHALLATLLPPGMVCDTILGDLHEGYVNRVESRSRRGTSSSGSEPATQVDGVLLRTKNSQEPDRE